MAHLRHFTWHLGIALLLTVGVFVVFRQVMQQGSPQIQIDAQSNFVNYTVKRRASAAIAVYDAVVGSDQGLCPGYAATDTKGTRLTALIVPSEEDTVQYQWNPGFVMLSYLGPGGEGDPKLRLQARGKPDCILNQILRVFIYARDLENMPPLPLAGPGSIGEELRNQVPPSPSDRDLPGWLTGQAPPGVTLAPAPEKLLYGGTVQVLGQTHSPWDSGSLYPIPDSLFELPRGGRVQSSGNAWLTGTVALARDGRGFDVRAKTESSSLLVYAAGAQQQHFNFDTGALDRAFADPSAAPALLFLAIFAFVISTQLSFAALSRDLLPPSDKKPRDAGDAATTEETVALKKPAETKGAGKT